MPQGPMSTYRARVENGLLDADPGQRAAVERLEDLYRRLGDGPVAREPARGFFGRPRPAPARHDAPRGLYLWGGVGRGKSMLMDLFHDNAPVEPKRRAHFHEFMQDVHARIRATRARDPGDPIAPVAREIAAGARLLCFDEMQVTDITDAMILGRLFDGLFAAGTVIVATSNRHPDDLYKDGLNRALFLPFIEKLKQRMEVHELTGRGDFRRTGVEAVDSYLHPLDARTAERIDGIWTLLTDGARGQPLTLSVSGREVVIPRVAGEVARVSFEELCARPLGPADYLALAERIGTLILEEVPVLSRARANEAKRFNMLIDALYEARRHLIISAEAPPDDLYRQGEGAFEFERTASRLQEMRSKAYLAALAPAS